MNSLSEALSAPPNYTPNPQNCAVYGASFSHVRDRPDWVAETVGFEPTIRGYRIHTFQACAFDHSATSPHYISPTASLREGVEFRTTTSLLECEGHFPVISISSSAKHGRPNKKRAL